MEGQQNALTATFALCMFYAIGAQNASDRRSKRACSDCVLFISFIISRKQVESPNIRAAHA